MLTTLRRLIMSAADVLEEMKYDDTTIEQMRLFRFAAANLREACIALYMIEEDWRKEAAKRVVS